MPFPGSLSVIGGVLGRLGRLVNFFTSPFSDSGAGEGGPFLYRERNISRMPAGVNVTHTLKKVS